ncbi:mitochondrial carrier domain-containing protein [Umbelopsis sp. PMI_123]|nr:mitochondrial carrier domain-containing protein [Umbelopsis sp. PMI_123]
MADTIDTITEVESIEQDSEGREPFRRFIGRTDSQDEKQDRRIINERDAQLQKRLTSSSERILSACAGAFVTSLLVTPLDVVKTRLQSQEKCAIGSIHFHHKAVDIGNKQLNGTLDGLYKIMRYEGVSSLWRGLSPALVISIPATVMYLVGYDAVRDKTRQHIGEDTILYQYSPLWAGGVARSFAACIISPIELFRTRMQSVDGVKGFRSVFDGVQTMVQQHGPRSLWRGLVPTMWRDVPFSAFYWMSYEKSRSILAARAAVNEREGPADAWREFKLSFACGAISGMIAAILTTPFDVVKTRLQISSRQERRMLYSINEIYHTEGIRGLFRGCIPRLAKIAPSCAIMISSYELGKMFFARKRAKELQSTLTIQ